jgi:hypothetical protein
MICGVYVAPAAQQPLRDATPLRPLGGAFAAAAPCPVSAIATIPAGDDIMTPFIAALSRTARSIRHAVSRIGRRFARRAEIKLGITASLPPFLKFAFEYKADIGEAANDNTSSEPRQSA